jgi:hypothetical protein
MGAIITMTTPPIEPYKVFVNGVEYARTTPAPSQPAIGYGLEELQDRCDGLIIDLDNLVRAIAARKLGHYDIPSLYKYTERHFPTAWQFSGGNEEGNAHVGASAQSQPTEITDEYNMANWDVEFGDGAGVLAIDPTTPSQHSQLAAVACSNRPSRTSAN